MGYNVRLSRRVLAEIRGWHLPDKIVEEVYDYLELVLPADPEHNLHRESETGATGMRASMTRRDPYVPGREHLFTFWVYFSQDEEALVIERGNYVLDDPFS